MIAKISTDYALIRSIFTHSAVWPYVCDDASADAEAFQPNPGDGRCYVVPEIDGVPIGCFALHDCNAVTVELHTAILPEYRGGGTQAAFAALVELVRAELPAVRRIRTWVPDFNKPAFKAALHAGMTHCGTEAASFLRFGALHDLHLFGVSIPCP